MVKNFFSESNVTLLQEGRASYIPKVPKFLDDIFRLELKKTRETNSSISFEESGGVIGKLFPKTFGRSVVKFEKSKELPEKAKMLKVGVVLSGGQAPGGHNVIAGLFDALKKLNPKSELYGFLGGPSGILEDEYAVLTGEKIDLYRNQGGFDLIGSGRTKIETDEQLKKTFSNIKKMKLDGLVIIGGDDSNTNAAIIAEYFLQNGLGTIVVGVPKTIDGDLKSEHIEISFGHDTACKVYSELIGNIERDCFSAKKYYHFIKLMGRAASNVTLECALQTHPNMTIIGEEVAMEDKTLLSITDEICDMICRRAEEGKNYGVVLIPEGLIEFIPEMKKLIAELNDIVAKNESGKGAAPDEIVKFLTEESAVCFKNLPKDIQEQLLLDRDPHGNVQVSRIETEELIVEMVEEGLKKRKVTGKYSGKFSPQTHFLGYEARASLPSNFDAQYCYSLGMTSALLVNSKMTGYIARVYNLSKPVEKWGVGGVPITMMMNMEQRKGKAKPVIVKALVNLNGKPFNIFKTQRIKWMLDDYYRYPGPIQFYGPEELTDQILLTLDYDKN